MPRKPAVTSEVLKPIETDADIASLVRDAEAASPVAEPSQPAPSAPPVAETPQQSVSQEPSPPATDKTDGNEKPDVQPEPKQQPVKSLRKRFNTFFEPDSDKGDTVDGGQKPMSHDELRQEVEKLRQIVSDPAVKMILEAKSKGRNLVDVIDELGSNPLAGKSDRDKYAYYLKQNGITDEDELDDELSKFDSMTRLAQRREIAAIEQEVARQREAKLIELLGKPYSNPEEEKRIQMFNKAATEIETLVNNAIGKNIFNITFTREMADKVMGRIADGLIPKKEDGSIDSVGLFKMVFTDLYRDLIFDVLEKEFETRGAVAVLDEMEARPHSSVHAKKPVDDRQVKKGTPEYFERVSQTLQPLQ